MANVVRGMVEGIGIADTLPVNPLYFTEVTIPETLTIPAAKPDMEQLLSIQVEAVVVSVRSVVTPIGISNEGQSISGAKIIIELKLREKIKYVADEPTQSVHAAHFENVFTSIFVVVPPTVGGVPISDLLASNRVTVTPYIEDIYGTMRDKRTIFKNTAILVDVTIRTV